MEQKGFPPHPVNLHISTPNLHISGPSPFMFPGGILVSSALETTRSTGPVPLCWLEDSSDWDQSPGEVAGPLPLTLPWTFCLGSRLRRVGEVGTLVIGYQGQEGQSFLLSWTRWS